MIAIKRAYEKAGKGDGRRVLVDRLWPRGASKAELALDAWEKDLAPSDALRKWFGHKPERWAEFKRRYAAELRDKRAELRALKKSARTLTLVYGAKDPEHNNAKALKAMLERLS
jgi:uncharacterized protein YeaO (DUF488 family)